MKKGDIFLINFDPSFGKEYRKIRPALIMQSEKICSNLVTTIPISSKVNKSNKNDIRINKNNKNRLFCDSLIKVGQISSFDKRRIFHFIGNVDSNILSEVDDYLRKHFEL